MTLSKLIKEELKNERILHLAIAKAADRDVIESIIKPLKEGLVHPILIDDEQKLNKILGRFDIDNSKVTIINEADDSKASVLAVKEVRDGRANALMKGKLGTNVLLKAVVNKETGIRKSETLSHVAVLYVPKLNRLIAISDGGMNLTPNKKQLSSIIEASEKVMENIGISRPKISILSANEAVLPKLQSSVDAHEIMEENISDRIIEGPLSIDISLSPKIALDKGYKGKIQGDADILITPDIVSGNLLSKSLLMFGGAEMAGLVVGAKVPIVLTSRSASSEEKYASILLATTQI